MVHIFNDLFASVEMIKKLAIKIKWGLLQSQQCHYALVPGHQYGLPPGMSATLRFGHPGEEERVATNASVGLFVWKFGC